MKYFYIHGFGSSADSETRKQLEAELGEPVVGLTYDYTEPKNFIVDMFKQIDNHLRFSDVRIVIFASSLGAYVAQRISYYYQGSIFVLYNPSTKPEDTLGKYGVSQEVLDRYCQLPLEPITSTSVSRIVILSKDDEVLDYKVAEDLFSKSARIVHTTGGHRMTPENIKLLVKEAKFSMNQILP